MLEQGLPPEFSQYVPDILEAHAEMVARALLALPLAAILGAVLAFRPRAPRHAAAFSARHSDADRPR